MVTFSGALSWSALLNEVDSATQSKSDARNTIVEKPLNKHAGQTLGFLLRLGHRSPIPGLGNQHCALVRPRTQHTMRVFRAPRRSPRRTVRARVGS